MLGKESWLVHEERLSSLEAENNKLRKDLYECIHMVNQCYKRQEDLYDLIRNERQPKILVGAPIAKDEYEMLPQEIALRRAQQDTRQLYERYYTTTDINSI